MSLIATLISLAAAAALPSAPADGISDAARIIGDQDRAALTQAIASLQKDTGVRLFIETNSYLGETVNLGERTRDLIREWGQGHPSAVICVDRSSTAPPSIQFSEAVWARYNTLDVVNTLRTAVSEMIELPVNSTELAKGVNQLVTGLKKSERLARARDRVITRRDAFIAAAFAAVVLLGGLFAWFVSRRLRQREFERAVQHSFPDVEVSQRFGANCGGGVIVEIAFRK